MRSQVSQQSRKDGASWWGPKRCRRLGGSAAATGLWGWFSEEASGGAVRRIGSHGSALVGLPSVSAAGRSLVPLIGASAAGMFAPGTIRIPTYVIASDSDPGLGCRVEVFDSVRPVPVGFEEPQVGARLPARRAKTWASLRAGRRRLTPQACSDPACRAPAATNALGVAGLSGRSSPQVP